MLDGQRMVTACVAELDVAVAADAAVEVSGFAVVVTVAVAVNSLEGALDDRADGLCVCVWVCGCACACA